MHDRPVRVLQILIGGKTFSGVSSYLYQYYKHMDHSVVHYDFLFCRENSMELVKNDSVLGGSKFYVLHAVKGKSNDYFKITHDVHQILKEEGYDAVVVNTSIIAVICACLRSMHGIPDTKFIAHAHNTDLVLGKNSLRAKFLFISKSIDRVLRAVVRRRADFLFGCTAAAGEMTFGKNAIKLTNFRLVKNAIDVDAFEYKEDVRTKVRVSFNIENSKIVYGNVGSFCKRKNQLFLIDVFNKIHEQNSDTELWLIGDGDDREKIEDMVARLNLQNSVRILGQRDDVSELMQGMDFFVFPTLSEGLGIVAIEAQTAGLFTVVSDGVPEDVFITDRIMRIELQKNAEFWANELLKIKRCKKRKDVRHYIISAGFDIEKEAEKLTEFLVSIS